MVCDLVDLIKVLKSINASKDYDEEYLSLIITQIDATIFDEAKSELSYLPSQTQIFLDLFEEIQKLVLVSKLANLEPLKRLYKISMTALIRILPNVMIEDVQDLAKKLEELPQEWIDNSYTDIILQQIYSRINQYLKFYDSNEAINHVVISETIQNLGNILKRKYGKYDKGHIDLINFWMSYLSTIEKSLLTLSPSIFVLFEDILVTTKSMGIISEQKIQSFLISLSNLISLPKYQFETRFGFYYLNGISFIKALNLTSSQIHNFNYIIHFLKSSTHIKDITQNNLLLFFEAYKNLKGSGRLLTLDKKDHEVLDIFRNSLLRYFSDHFREFKIENFEGIFLNCMQSDLLHINFDDGTELYNKTLLEEVQEYLKDSFKNFSPEFQNMIQNALHITQETFYEKTFSETIHKLEDAISKNVQH